MFTVTRQNDNLLYIELNGKLDRNSMKVALDELVTESVGVHNGMMLYRVSNLQWPSMGAIGEEISRMPELLSLMKQFNRAAVLTDKEWVKKASEFEGAIIPNLEIKGFTLAQELEALTWLKDK
ncbi:MULTISPECIES: SpoIIAA family protein [Vibrio]|uniref:STAS/SEC14 domain-containing protein n=1 Tax=Vibrio casei TaxID=673372 RepID=A0A368LHD8_9VIBR|nr:MULTISPECIES: STAS/SEC14 domain-containing protein [Vibrio]RCS70036.1 STAS/SEC14 domain-containing protein [Vibrio casei]SJN33940.1 hypothetical protein FM109_12220 [Vibrio casei]HBV76757.1 STAS/SEC14 domain-containing protein [Vibrio sp.]